MGRRAYLIGFLNRETCKFEGCEIFSEENPSCSFRYFPFTITWRDGPTFDSALKSLESVLNLPEYSFLKPMMNKRKYP